MSALPPLPCCIAATFLAEFVNLVESFGTKSNLINLAISSYDDGDQHARGLLDLVSDVNLRQNVIDVKHFLCLILPSLPLIFPVSRVSVGDIYTDYLVVLCDLAMTNLRLYCRSLSPVFSKYGDCYTYLWKNAAIHSLPTF